MDQVYIRKVLEGDAQAFRYFITTYQDMAFAVALSIVKEEHLAQDVCQEAFMRCYQSLGSVRGNSKFSTWFYKLVVNAAFQMLRKVKVDLVEFDVDKHDDMHHENVLSQVIAQEQTQMVNDALALMPPKEAVALRLFYLEEMSMDELQQILGWTLANTKVILHRARKRLQMILATKIEKGVYNGK